MEEKKPWYKSKTMLVNGAVAVAGTLGAVAQYSGVATAVVPAAAPYFALFAALNMFLRAITSQPLGKSN